MNPETMDNAMGGGRDGVRQASLEPQIIWRKKMNIGKVERMRKYLKY
jgi:hypothetical protein